MQGELATRAGRLAKEINKERQLLRHSKRALDGVRKNVAQLANEAGADALPATWVEYVGDMRAAATWLDGKRDNGVRGRFLAGTGVNRGERTVRVRGINDPTGTPIVETSAKTLERSTVGHAIASMQVQHRHGFGAGKNEPKKRLQLELKHTGEGIDYALTATIEANGRVETIEAYETSARASGIRTRRLVIGNGNRELLEWIAEAAARQPSES